MATQPKEASKSRLSNIMGLLRGNFVFDTPAQSDEKESKPIAYGSPQLISEKTKNVILSRALIASETRGGPTLSPASLLSMVQTSLTRTGNERLENRKILQLMPDVDKAARLMIASSLSPVDLARREIKVVVDDDTLDEKSRNRLSEFCTKYFQEKLNLKTSVPSWIYQFGYETGSCPFAVVPLRSFKKIEDESFVGTESFINRVVNPICEENLFGFGDGAITSRDKDFEMIAMESFAHTLINNEKKHVNPDDTHVVDKHITDSFVRQVLATEALSLTDNPSVLQTKQLAKEKAEKRTKEILDQKFIRPKAELIVNISHEDALTDEKDGLIGDPILMRLPPESVTIIHTPGDPNDHQAYIILLNRNGDPINAVAEEESAMARPVDYNSNQGNIFAQVYNAYGFTTGSRGITNEDTMIKIYSQVVGEHIKDRITKAGYNNAHISNSDAVFRCMFSRFLQSKQTRLLFLPKELVTYMTFEKDQNGYGVSRLDRIKFNLGIKMAVQVAKVLASIKSAMDNRVINVRFTDNLMEQPEAVFQTIIREYVAKSTMSFSIDPNVIQSQIADKSMQIKGSNIPGMEEFELTNEPAQRSNAVDFDPDLLNYNDKAIYNGLKVPAASMNSLSEDEYARSVATTNLFFSMDISIDQDIIIKCVSDLLRKYARFSKSFRDELLAELPNLDEKDDKGTNNDNIDVENIINSLSISLPQPNVAPSKAQFESLDAMVSSITNMVNAIFPDDLVGIDDSLRPVIGMLRAKFVSINIREYLDKSGLSGFEIPDTNFSSSLKDISELLDSLKNVEQMMKDKDKISGDPTSNSFSSPSGFGDTDGFGEDDSGFGEDEDTSGGLNPDGTPIDKNNPPQNPNDPLAQFR